MPFNIKRNMFQIKATNKIIISLLIGVILLGCEQKSTPAKKNEKLIGFKSEWLGEVGSDQYKVAEPLAESKKIETKQIDDLLIIKTWKFLNTCGKYGEDISIYSDTIHLELDLISDEVCTSTSIRKLTYIVDNPDSKKWVIK